MPDGWFFSLPEHPGYYWLRNLKTNETVIIEITEILTNKFNYYSCGNPHLNNMVPSLYLEELPFYRLYGPIYPPDTIVR